MFVHVCEDERYLWIFVSLGVNFFSPQPKLSPANPEHLAELVLLPIKSTRLYLAAPFVLWWVDKWVGNMSSKK